MTDNEMDLRLMLSLIVRGQCPICGWPLKNNPSEGCVPGNCSFRPDEHNVAYPVWIRRHKLITEIQQQIDPQTLARNARKFVDNFWNGKDGYRRLPDIADWMDFFVSQGVRQ
jgi:hypothetical protein